jgi:hypothetical protein
MATIAALMRYEQVSLLENELLSVDTLARKYGDAERQYLVKPDSDQRN